MKYVIRGASRAALLLGLAGSIQGAFAQTPTAPATPQGQTVTTNQPGQAPASQAAPEQVAQPGEQSAPTNRVVVTGSLIATLPEDAPKPVEVYTREQLEESGSPSVNEFLRNLTVASDTSGFGGEANSTGGATTGFTAANLRGLGASGTLTLLNGKRLASTNGGSGADSNTLPTGALEAVEILKGGASTTYGAGAVGGVINYVTRRDIDAPEITLEQRFYDRSAAETRFNFITGWVGDSGNVMMNYEFQNQERLRADERDFGTQPWVINPEGESTQLAGYNPGKFVVQPNYFGATPGTVTAASVVNDYRTPADCYAVGGKLSREMAPKGNSTDTTCVIPDYLLGADLVSEFTSHKVYIEANTDITDSMEFHIEGLYSKQETDRRDTPSSPAQNRAVLTPTGGTGTTICGTGFSCIFAIPGAVPLYNTAGAVVAGQATRNPFIDDFQTRTGRVIANTDALYTGLLWRPFGLQGNPQYDDGLSHNIVQRERFQVNAALKGQFTKDSWLGFLDGTNYEFSSQFNFYDQTQTYWDLSMSRYQNALLGYGGPTCQAKDRVATNYTSATTYNQTVGIQSDTRPGTNGCEWLNPFASNFQTSIANGAVNPQYNANLPQSSAQLEAWLMRKRVDELQNIAATFDATFSGELGFLELPGGAVGWAAGAQVRSVESRSNLGQSSSTADRAAEFNYCPWPGDQDLIGRGLTATNEPFQSPGQLGCSATTPPGTFYATGRPTPNYSDEQALGLYAEMQFPVLDTLNFNASVRRESYNGGDLVGNIWSVAGKYDITDNFYFRADYGTNFRNQGLSVVPGAETVSVSSALCCSARFGTGFGPLLINRTATDIGPEDDVSYNIGGGYRNDDFFGGRIDLGFTFFETIIEGDLVGGGTDTQPYTIMLNDIFGTTSPNLTGTVGTRNGGRGCDSPFVTGPNALVLLNSACTDATRGTDITGIIKIQQNGGGFVTNGIDYTLNYTVPVDVFFKGLEGNFGLNATATQTLVYKVHGYDLFGAEFAPDGDRLGLRNQNTGSGATTSREWRFNVLTRWSNTEHTVSLNTNYQSGVWDAGYLACTPEYFDASLPTAQRQKSRVGNFITCGNNLTAVNYDATGTALVGAAAYSTYGVKPKDYVTFDLSYIYRPTFSWAEGLELRATAVNVTDRNPVLDQTARGYGTGDPRGRIIELEVKKKF
jgi:iron complex outermembrane recepter protein